MIHCSTEKINFEEKYNHIADIAFHGTCDYYSDMIEKSGFMKSVTLLTQVQIDKLINCLEENPQFESLNETMNFGFCNEKISQTIRMTFETIKSEEYVFSMAIDFENALTFLSDEHKGGQYLKNIKKVIKGIGKLGSIDIPKEVDEIIEFINEIEKSKGVIYAIDIKGLEYENDGNRIQTKENISTKRIIAKYIKE